MFDISGLNGSMTDPCGWTDRSSVSGSVMVWLTCGKTAEKLFLGKIKVLWNIGFIHRAARMFFSLNYLLPAEQEQNTPTRCYEEMKLVAVSQRWWRMWMSSTRTRFWPSLMCVQVVEGLCLRLQMTSLTSPHRNYLDSCERQDIATKINSLKDI